jgi:enoyl-CoA hydratase
MSEPFEPAILAIADGSAGVITLNRPATLNALTLEMVQMIDEALHRFQDDSDVTTIIINGAGGRALCAGGDIRSIYDAALKGDPSPRTFWAQEYALNARLAHFPKPVVALMDGIVMGGGIGISAHASHRVVTERSVLAMPEVGIGFAPDVGGSWLLSRSPGEYGSHIALSTERLGAADAIVAGLADYYVTSQRLAQLTSALATRGVDEVLVDFASPPPEGKLASQRSWIDACYSAIDVEEILRRLYLCGGDAATAAKNIESNSPTSLKVTLRCLRNARELSNLEQCLEMEYRISCSFLETPDFIEGVRAAIIDKDRSPRWQPSRLEEVRDISRFFESTTMTSDLT